jgi:hypothetical protein
MAGSAFGTGQPDRIDAEWILDVITRCKLAGDYVSDLDGVIEAETALKTLVEHDVPILVRELVRLRPELS